MVNFKLSTHVWDWGSLWPGSAIFERHPGIPPKWNKSENYQSTLFFCRWMSVKNAFEPRLSLSQGKRRHGRRWSTHCNHGCRKLLSTFAPLDLLSWTWSNTWCWAWGSFWKCSEWPWRTSSGSVVILWRPPGCKWTETHGWLDFWLVVLPVLPYFS